MQPNSCESCVQNKGHWFGSHCIMPGQPMVYDAPLVSTAKGCRRKTAMDKAKCSSYKSCNKCTMHGKSKTYGQLCAWASYGSAGNCVQNNGGMWMRPMVTS